MVYETIAILHAHVIKSHSDSHCINVQSLKLYHLIIKLINMFSGNITGFVLSLLYQYQLLDFTIVLALLQARLTVVSREAKEEVPCDSLLTNAREYLQELTLLQ